MKFNWSLAPKTGLILLFSVFISELMIRTMFPKLMISSFLEALLGAGFLTFVVNFVVYRWVVIPVDQVETKMKLYRDQLEDAEHIAHFGSWEHDLKSDRVICSKGGAHLLGLDPEQTDLNFNSFLSMVRFEDRSMIKNALSNPDKNNQDFEFENKFQRKDGAVRIMRVHGRYYFDENENPIRAVGTIQDVTEIRNQEQVLVELQARIAKNAKLANMSQMSAGVHHEIVYPLAIIQEETNMILTLVRENQFNSETGYTNLENIFQMCERITKTMGNLKILP